MATSQKDYIAVAAVLRAQDRRLGGWDGTVADIAQGLADVFATDNPRFDREKFLQASCGVNAEEVGV